MAQPTIPLLDLGIQHRRIAETVMAGFREVIDDASFVLGPQVQSFEKAYADYCGVSHCVGVGNGTDAIELALRGLGVGAGDEVIVPANTFVATAGAVLRAGAKLVLADCREDYLIDLAAVADKLTPRTRAVIAVHLYGQPAPMSELAEVVRPDIALVEDAAQSQGARQRGRRSGSLGVVAATSFYPGKNLGAYGDAGAVTTDEDEIATRLRRLRNHGGIAKYEHVEVGVNSRLDSLQAVVLSAKLAVLDEWNAERRAAADRYAQLLADLADRGEVVLPRVVAGNEHVWHLYVVRVPNRDVVLKQLNAAGIGAGIHYPTPLHRLPAFEQLRLGDYPCAERLAEQVLSLPLFPGITFEQQERVTTQLRAALL